MKRRRYQARPKRRFNKKIFNILQSPTTTQAETTLSSVANSTSTAAFTFKMNKLSIAAIGNTSASTLIRWALIKVPDGYSLNTLSATSGVPLYQPESDVLACGVMALADSDSGTGSSTACQNFKLKCSRKLQEGDSVVFVTDTNNATAVSVIALATFVELF